MKSFLPKRKRSLAPTPEQMQTAEDVVFTAMRSGKALLTTKTPLKDCIKLMEDRVEQDVGVDEYITSLGKTSIEDFLSSFRVNGLDCMTRAYE